MHLHLCWWALWRRSVVHRMPSPGADEIYSRALIRLRRRHTEITADTIICALRRGPYSEEWQSVIEHLSRYQRPPGDNTTVPTTRFLAETRPGLHLVSDRKAFGYPYQHHGITLGDGHVVEFSGFNRPFRRGPVQAVPLSHFINGSNLLVVRYDKNQRFSPAESARRARLGIGDNNYQLLKWNCEHFARWVCTGSIISDQADDLVLILKSMRGTAVGALLPGLFAFGSGARLLIGLTFQGMAWWQRDNSLRAISRDNFVRQVSGRSSPATREAHFWTSLTPGTRADRKEKSLAREFVDEMLAVEGYSDMTKFLLSNLPQHLGTVPSATTVPGENRVRLSKPLWATWSEEEVRAAWNDLGENPLSSYLLGSDLVGLWCDAHLSVVGEDGYLLPDPVHQPAHQDANVPA